MIERLHWRGQSTDPFAQLVSESPIACDRATLLVSSQVDAIAHWPDIESFNGDVFIVLRRVGREDEAEWRDALSVLGELVAASSKQIRFFALTGAAAEQLNAETTRSIDVLPALARRYIGDRCLMLSRKNGSLRVWHDQANPYRGGQFNLARLRRMAVIEADAEDLDLTDVATYANGKVLPGARATKHSQVVIIVVPNGTGIGHVTRMLAVARHLREDLGARVVFWSFSRAAGIISRFGFETILRQTAQHLGADIDDWLRWETEEFAKALATLKPDLVLQDASALQDFVIDALARPLSGSARLVLVRRGMWQKQILAADALDAEKCADLVLEPGDLAAAADRGITRGRAAKMDSFAAMTISAPVTLTRPEEMLDPRQARKALGLGRGRNCLVSLGGDALWDWAPFQRYLVDAAQKARVKLVWARSPLAAQDAELQANPNIVTLNVYPLAPFLAAFDGVVSAVGYNSFHELMQLYDRPVLLVPRQHSRLDDQRARAEFASAQGWARHLPDEDHGQEIISAFMADIKAGKTLRARPAWRDGAAEIAATLTELMDPEGCAP